MEMEISSVSSEANPADQLISEIKRTLMRAWTERWREVQFAVHLKRILTTHSSEGVDVAEILLQLALINNSPKSLVLSYLKHIVLSQVISHTVVFKHISSHEDQNKPYCVIALIDLAQTFATKLSFSYGVDSSLQMCQSLLLLVHWLLNHVLKCLQKMLDGKSSPEIVSITERASSAIQKTLNKQTVCHLLHIARAETTAKYLEFEQCMINVRGTLSQLTESQTVITAQTRDKVTDMLTLLLQLQDIKLPSLNEDESPKIHLSATINTLVTLEAVLNSTNELQPFVDQIMVIARLLFSQKLSWPKLYVEIFRACFMGVIDTPSDSREELKWTSFTFLKVPRILQKLQQHSQGRDVTKDLEQSLELLLAYPNLLDLADLKHKCDSVEHLLQGCIKSNLLTDKHKQRFMQKRNSERGRPIDKSSSETVILRAKSNVLSILKVETLDTDYQKNQDPLLSVLCQMLSGKGFEIILAATASMEELQNFAVKLIKVNECSRHSAAGEGGKASQTRAGLFDVTFLMLCYIVQRYGINTITTTQQDVSETFFVVWAQRWLPDDGKYKNIENCSPSDPNKVEPLLTLFLSSGEHRTSLVPWHEICLNTPFAIQEVLFAWEHGAINTDQVKTVVENVKSWMCCLPVVVSCWLCCYINTSDHERRGKPLQMLEQFMTISNKSESSTHNDRFQFMKMVIKLLSHDVLPSNHTYHNVSHDVLPTNHIYRNESQQYLPANEPPAVVFEETLKYIFNKRWVNLKSLYTLKQVLNLSGSNWFCDQVIQCMLKINKSEELCLAVSLVFALFHMDLEHLTLSLLTHTLPRILHSADTAEMMTNPRGYTLAKLTVMCITAAQVSKVGGQKEPYVRRGGKRSRIEVDVDEMDDCEERPDKIRKISEPQLTLLSEDFTFDDMNVKEDEETLPTFDTDEPLNKALVNMFCLMNAIIHNKKVTVRTSFIRSFIDEALKCGPQYYRFIFQFMPSTMLLQLMKTMPGIFNNRQILHVCDLSVHSGRKLAAKAVCHNQGTK